ncbi:hypothetical protein J7K99_07490 [bacterium]|nr:hypothetical protein [bacterium]
MGRFDKYRREKPKTGWEKAKPYVLGIGIPVLLAGVIVILAMTLFSQRIHEPAEVVVETELPPVTPITPTQMASSQSTGGNQTAGQTQQTPTPPPTPVSTGETAAETAASAGTAQTQPSQQASDSAVMVLDTAKVRELEMKKVQEEIVQMRQQYHENRVKLLQEAVRFLRGQHTQRAVKAKGANFKKLAEQLRQKINEFPQPSSEYEKMLWDAQKEELAKTADFLEKIGNRVAATNGVERKMRATANALESEGAP